MNKYFDNLRLKRLRLLDITSGLTPDQYNFVPPGFNNNVIWNMGHVLTVSDRRLEREHGFSAPDHGIDLDLFARGTRPSVVFDQHAILAIRYELLHSVAVYEQKSNALLGTAGSSGTMASSLEFLLFHEDYHYLRVEELLKATAHLSLIV
ncbi:DinB family protein [Mucilaginibacter phyllosphaerae]